MEYDVAIIGAGITGSAIAMELSKFKLDVCVIEKSDDVSMGTSKANSGIIHAGYDPKPGSLMASLNILGSRMYEKLSKNLDFPYKKIGALVLGFNEEDSKHIKKLYERGLLNGLSEENLKILSKEELFSLEPNVNEGAILALYAKDSAIVSPYLVTLAFMENAVDNGSTLFLNSQVHSIEKKGDTFEISTSRDVIKSKIVVNAAGLYADSICQMVGGRKFSILPRMGEYFLLDKKCSHLASHTIFQTPDLMGKGILLTPTVDGNILAGPSAVDIFDKENTQTTREGQDFVFERACKSLPSLPKRNIINSFSGIRSIAMNEDGSPVNDFIIEEDSSIQNFVNVAGICSPGLSAAPAIGEYVSSIVLRILSRTFKVKAEKKEHLITKRKSIESFIAASEERKKELVKENPLYGRIICRCEMITEEEIVQAINSKVGAVDLDGVKRRTRCGMGRCQGGFCSPRVTEILSREKKINMECVTKCGGYSYVLNSKTR